MRNCEFCGAENTDFAAHCTACNEPMTAEAAKADVKAEEKKAHDRLIRKELVYGGIAALTVVALIFAGVRSYKKKQVREEAQTFYKSFNEEDSKSIPEFWKCIARSDKQPKDNIELENMINAALNKTKGGYAEWARKRCMPKIESAPSSLDSVRPTEAMADAYGNYIGAVKVLAKQANLFLVNLDAIEKEQKRDATVQKQAANYHYAGGESADTWAYDKFLRCAIPEFQTMTEMQQLLEALGNVMKDPVPHVQRWRKECYKIIEQTAGTVADADYKKKVEAFSTDDRDVQGFQDVLNKANDKMRAEAIAPFVKNWYEFGQARDTLLAKFGEYLND